MFYILQQKTPTGWAELERFSDRDLAWRELANLGRRWPSAQFRWVRDL